VALDTRWKLPQGKTPDALYDCLFQLVRELRKGDYLNNITLPALSAADIDFAATQRVLGRNTTGAGAGEEVTLSQLLDWIGSAAQGDVLYRGSSAWARLAAGTSGQFLQTQGTGANPQWATVSGGGITTIASGSLPAATTQPLTDIPATYAYLILKLTGASSNTGTRQPLVRASTDNGSSYDSTAANYAGTIYNSIGLALGNTTLASLGESADGAASVTWDATINLFGYQSGPEMTYLSRFRTSVGIEYHIRGTYRSTSAVNALQILWNGSGNFDAGTYALYGVS